jgi:hypothetical protein
MTTMITGGAGLIGSYLARLLIEEGDKPVLFDIAPVQGPLTEMKGRFVFEQGTLSHLPVIMDCVERHGIDRIFHLGGMLSLPSENSPWDAFDVNVVGTLNILEAARIKKMKQVVYASTIATYSKDIQGDVIDDRTILWDAGIIGGSASTSGECDCRPSWGRGRKQRICQSTTLGRSSTPLRVFLISSDATPIHVALHSTTRMPRCRSWHSPLPISHESGRGYTTSPGSHRHFRRENL